MFIQSEYKALKIFGLNEGFDLHLNLPGER